MVRIEKDKLIIEIETIPDQLLNDLLIDIIVCVQAIQCLDSEFVDEKLGRAVCTLLELYKALLPDERMVKKMYQKEKKEK